MHSILVVILSTGPVSIPHAKLQSARVFLFAVTLSGLIDLIVSPSYKLLLNKLLLII